MQGARAEQGEYEKEGGVGEGTGEVDVEVVRLVVVVVVVVVLGGLARAVAAATIRGRLYMQAVLIPAAVRGKGK